MRLHGQTAATAERRNRDGRENAPTILHRRIFPARNTCHLLNFCAIARERFALE
jgi:hypothetical protein